LFRQQGIVPTLAFSRDGRYLSSASEDSSARVWRIEDGWEVWREQYNSTVLAAGFSANGLLVTAALRGTVRCGEWRASELARSVCSKVQRNLTAGEWSSFLPGLTCRATCSQLPDLCQPRRK